jgi:calcineurin-like phosphoesterase family protein
VTIFITSDNHFFHKNILQYCQRPFKDVLEMNQTMIDNWNSVVTKDDLVFHLGDFCLCCNNQQLRELRDSLNGSIILIPGNHDHPTRLQNFNIFVFDSLYSEGVNILNNNLIFSHRPLWKIPDGKVNVHGHIHDKPSYGRYLNVSVDVANFTPISFEEVLKRAKEISNG